MSVSIIFKNADFSESAIERIYKTTPNSFIWNNGLINWNSSEVFESIDNFRCAFVKIPKGTDTVKFTEGLVNHDFGVSLVKNVNNENKTFTNVARNILTNPNNGNMSIANKVLDVSKYTDIDDLYVVLASAEGESWRSVDVEEI